MHPLSDIRIRNNRVVQRVMQRFELFVRKTSKGKKNYKMYLDDVTPETLHDLWEFAREEHTYYEKYPDLYAEVPEPRAPKQRGENTLDDYFNKIRTFFRWCYENELTMNRPFDKFHVGEPVYGTPVYMNLEERDKLLDTDFSDNPRLERQRDIFIFQSLVGCRVSDLYALTRKSIVNGAVEYIASKTADGRPETIRVPLIDISRNILKKYEYWEGPSLFPFLPQQDYNEDIKKVFKAAGLTRQVTILNPTTRKQEHKELWEVASSHMARRAFVGNLYRQLKDKTAVAVLSGHKSDSKSFDRYWTPDETMREDTAQLLSRQDRRVETIDAIHPGRLLKEMLKARSIKPSSMAARLETEESTLNEIISGEQSMTDNIALGLQQQLGISAQAWMTLQKEYDALKR